MFPVSRWMKRPRRPRLKVSGRRRIPRQAVLIVAVGCVALAAGVWSGSISGRAAKGVLHAKMFEIRAIKIHGLQRISRESVLRRMALGNRPTLLTIPLDAVRKRLLDEPWIAAVTVHKIFPDTLWVEIAEREAVAVIPTGTRMSLVDSDGVLLGEPGEEAASLPRVDGLDSRALASGDAGERSRLKSAMELVSSIKNGPLADRAEYGLRVAVSASDGVSVDLPPLSGEDGVLRLKLGRDGIDEKLRRFVLIEKDVMRRASQEGKTGAEVDLRFTRQVIVRPLA